MRQTILSVVLDVEPQSAKLLAQLIEDFKAAQEPPGAKEWYSEIKERVPLLHFMSMSVFENPAFDPIFVVEANFDGPPGPFWAQMEAAFDVKLRAMLRCCKRPEDGDGPMYDAVTKRCSRYPLAPYFEERTFRPSVFHQGNRGLGRDRILNERELFLATRRALAQPIPTAPNPYRGITAGQIHQKLRAELLAKFPWLAMEAPARISWLERADDLGRLLGFVFVVLLCLSIPGMALAPLMPAHWFLVGALVGAGIVVRLWQKRAALPGEGVRTRSGGLTIARMSAGNKVILGVALVAVLVLHVIIASSIGFVGLWITGWTVHDAACLAAKVVGLGVVSIVIFTAPAVVLWLRLLDVPAALSARRYAVEDRLVVEVGDDDIGGFAAGRYVLDGGPDGAKCTPSTVDTPDLRVHQRALAAAYLGGTSLHSQLIAGRVDELTTGALRRADAMFATPTAPWCATGF